MNREQFKNIVPMLKMYKDCCHDMDSQEAWFQSLKTYDYQTIDTAVRQYINTAKFPPVPASIIELIPKAEPDKAYKPRYEEVEVKVNGQLERMTVKVIQCRRCRDTGLITWENDEGYRFGRPCDCPAGHDNYPSAWKEEEQT